MMNGFFGRGGNGPQPPNAPTEFSATAIQSDPPGQPLNREAAVVYGAFVNLAYDIFGTPSSSSFTVPSGHHVSAYIFMYDFLFFARHRQFYGFIATQDGDPYSHVLAIRGTEGWWEWWDDAVFFPTTFQPVPEAGPVHSGFYRIYHTMALYPLPGSKIVALNNFPVPPGDPEESFADQLERFLASGEFLNDHPTLKANPNAHHHHFVVTGHSLGSALCTLYVMEHAVKKLIRNENRRVTIERVCTFASPRVGTGKFVSQFHGLPIDSWRIANSQDIVPKVPPRWPFGYRHVEDSYVFTSENVVKSNPSCWHSMYTYLNWLNSQSNPIKPECRIS